MSGVQTQKRTFHATLICQPFEVAILAVLAAVGDRLPNATVVPIISFVAALQNTSFATIGPWSFNSAMMTGNLRDAVSGLALGTAGRETVENRRKAFALGLIYISFLAGALFGGTYSHRHAEHALVPCVVIVVIGSLITWKLSRQPDFV